MAGEPGAKGAPRPFTDERVQGQYVFGLGEQERDALLAWVGENLIQVRRSAFGQRTLYWSLGTAWCSLRSGRRLKSASTSRPSMPTRRRWAIRPESEVARPPTRRAPGARDFTTSRPKLTCGSPAWTIGRRRALLVEDLGP